MNVDLVAYSQVYGNATDIVEMAASVCYDSKPDFANHKIAKGCAKTGHMSVFEHAYFTFHITGISRACLAQLTRHRHFSFTVRSQRYCDESGNQMINPAKYNEEARQMYEQAYTESEDMYKALIAHGENKEDARMVLLNAASTELYLSMNARALIEACHLRLCARAQTEIRCLFELMKQEVGAVSPLIAELCVPQCEVNPSYPFCTERKSCGRHKTLKEVYHDDSK